MTAPITAAELARTARGHQPLQLEEWPSKTLDYCRRCHGEWPCVTYRLLGVVREVRAFAEAHPSVTEPLLALLPEGADANADA